MSDTLNIIGYSCKPEKNETLLEYIKRCYHANDIGVIAFLEKRNIEAPIKTYRDFAKAISDMEKIDEPNISIFKNENLAICQEFLGNLNEIESIYAKQQGGTWYSNFDFAKGVSINISMRTILNDLKFRYNAS